jgi:cupin fold WbuC family metalloprotein
LKIEMKRLEYKLFDEIEEKAKISPRHRMNHDLRTQATDLDTSWLDTSQRMLNVMMKDTLIPIHRHTETSETVIILRGSGDEVTYNDEGKETERVTLRYGSDCAAVQVPRNTYHTFIPHEDGTVIFEAKDRAYDPEKTEEMLVTHS